MDHGQTTNTERGGPLGRRSSLPARRKSISPRTTDASSAWKYAAGSVATLSDGQVVYRRDSRRGSIGSAIIDAMVVPDGNRSSARSTPSSDEGDARTAPGGGPPASGWARLRSSSVCIQSLGSGPQASKGDRRTVQKEVDKMIETNTKIIKALEEDAIMRTLRNERSNAIQNAYRRGSVHAQGGEATQQQEAQLGRRSSFSVTPEGPQQHQQGRRGSLANREFMELIKDKECRIHEQHTSNISPLRPGQTQPAAMPMWRGYSVLEKEDHTIRGGTITANQDLRGSSRGSSPNTAGGYGSKTIKQEITLAPTHLGIRFGRRKSSVSEQLAQGMEEVGRARGELSKRSKEIKQNRRESFTKLLTKPKAPGWLAAERQMYTRRRSQEKAAEQQQVERSPEKMAEQAKLKTRLRFPDIKKLLYSRVPWYLQL
ncbi:hypothetical protein HOP50_14g71670 [Chloropicon primus]|uniref:Uncharacterized protein n=1 Tax=Chloropicon primus TaxID=1764295 RepID=A0A5B8MVR2_9CHLO|nr:hypothetical protein A3770_14p71470 [Chloropicon primus]UPR03837.1 hypothetical protein HOP50_14g71670 [Chloropicon primus]|eukprot:QDZ24629.1 hypothetical protein A3770_14p71470 [Chloropicon primus]